MTENQFIELFQTIYKQLDRNWEDKNSRLSLLQQMKHWIEDYSKVLNEEIKVEKNR